MYGAKSGLLTININYGSKNLKLYTRFAPQKIGILMGRVCTKVVNRTVKVEILSFWQFLPLLDSVSRGHGMGGGGGLVRRPSVCPSVRPSVAPLSRNLMHGFVSNFGCCFPWEIYSGVTFAAFDNFFFYFFTNIFRCR